MQWIPFITAWDDRVLLWLNSFVGRWPVFDRYVAVLLTTSELKFGVIVAVCEKIPEKILHYKCNLIAML